MGIMNGILKDNMQAEFLGALTPRYDVVGKSTEEAAEFTVERPKLQLTTEQALGKGKQVDLIV